MKKQGEEKGKNSFTFVFKKIILPPKYVCGVGDERDREEESDSVGMHNWLMTNVLSESGNENGIEQFPFLSCSAPLYYLIGFVVCNGLYMLGLGSGTTRKCGPVRLGVSLWAWDLRP